MFRSILQKLGYPEVPLFARESIDNFNLNFDKLLLYIMYIQWFGAAFIAAIPYETYLYGLFGGALISLLLTLAYKHYRGTRTLRVLFAIGMMLFSLIYIQQFFGRIEMHFHVFI
ncbi:MAG: GGDEF-domain containing protein, partial [Epsilonproteobacteria bacterium]|nr:GGDEF-domain containing protein [Campylobacterota bacterium]